MLPEPKLSEVYGQEVMRNQIRWIYNSGFDLAYGISTSERRDINPGEPSTFADQIKYVPIDYLALAYLFKPMMFARQDVFVDIGCGLGRAVLMASRRPIQHAIGVEYDQNLSKRARENAARLRGRRAPVDILCMDAIEADYSAATIIWMYNPFGEQTMKAVLDRIGASLIRAPRHLLIAYANPRLAPLLDAQNWVRRREERQFPGARENGHAIYWEAPAH